MSHVLDAASWFINFVADSKWSKITLGVFITLVVVEQVVIAIQRRPTHGELLPNLATTLVNMLVDVWAGGFFLLGYTLVFDHLRLLTVPETVVGYVYAFVVIELITYLQHWMYHRIGLLWAMHSVHHSGRELNVAVTNRSLWAISLFIPMMLFIPLLGISIAQFALIGIPRTLWAFLLHSELVPRLGILDRWLNTPSNHRVHHGRQPKYLDRNYSQGFILFDRIFGTYQAEEERPDYGLVNQVETRNPLKFQIAGFHHLYKSMRSADRWSDRLSYLYKPPGWSHADAHTTSKSLGQEQPAE